MGTRESPTSWATSPAVRSTMRGNRGRDTSPEMALRRGLHAAGMRYRLHVRVPGMPRRTIDVAWQNLRLAVFMDGCFWHGCPQHRVNPKLNAEFWGSKISRNRARDLETSGHLEQQGWLVLRFWEHDDVELAVQCVAAAVQSRRALFGRQSAVGQVR